MRLDNKLSIFAYTTFHSFQKKNTFVCVFEHTSYFLPLAPSLRNLHSFLLFFLKVFIHMYLYVMSDLIFCFVLFHFFFYSWVIWTRPHSLQVHRVYARNVCKNGRDGVLVYVLISHVKAYILYRYLLKSI